MNGAAGFRLNRWLARARRNPSALLLFVQLLGVVLYPLMENTQNGRILFSVFGLLVLGLALRVVRSSPAQTGVATVMALLVVALLGVNALWPHSGFVIAISVVEAAFYIYAAVALIAYMLNDQRATTDEIFAAGATFTLLAWAYAYIFMICQALSPASFTADATQTRSWMDLLFLSFTTLSGVGLGDIMPLTPMARALVMLAEFTGVMYIALVVSRLIGMTVVRSSADS